MRFWSSAQPEYRIRLGANLDSGTRRCALRLGVSLPGCLGRDAAAAGADFFSVIPVVVAKCGLYLKEHGTEVEGAFRISGSTKRMRELQTLFDTGPKVRDGIIPGFRLGGIMCDQTDHPSVRQEHRLEHLDIHDT